MSLGAASWGGRPLGGSGRASLTLRSGPGAGVADPGPPSGSGWEAPSSSGSPVGWTNVDEPRLKGEGGQASACLSASVKTHFFRPQNDLLDRYKIDLAVMRARTRVVSHAENRAGNENTFFLTEHAVVKV